MPMLLPRPERCDWCPPRTAPQRCWAVSPPPWTLCAEHVQENDLRTKERSSWG